MFSGFRIRSCASKGVRAALTDRRENPNGLTTYTFSGCNFGAEAGRSLVVVTAGGQSGNNRSINSVTIGGVTATNVVRNNNVLVPTGVFAAVVSGASGDVVVTFSSGINDCGIAVYALYNLQSTTAVASNGAVGTSSPLSANVNASEGGVVLAYARNRGGAAAPFYSWAGIDELFDELVSGPNNNHSGGFFLPTVAATPRTVNTTFANTPNAGSIVAASWR